MSPTTAPLSRFRFLEVATAQMGKPYVWGAKGPDFFDCSGVVTFSLKAIGGPDWRETHSSARLFDVSAPVDVPKPGDLAFYKAAGKVTHVMVVLGHLDGSAMVFGASGGGSQTTRPTASAFVKLKPDANYRPGFAGFRRLPQFP